MFELFSQNKKYLILGLVVATVSILILLLSTRKQAPPSAPAVPKSETPSLIPQRSTTFIPRSVLINQTSDQEIKQLPNLKRVTSSSSGELIYSLASERALRDDLIITQNSKAIFERKITDSRDPAQPSLDSYLQKFGSPEIIQTGSHYYGDFEKTYIFASHGVALLVDPFASYIDEVQSFPPMSIEEYKKSWGEDLYSNADPIKDP